MEYQIKNQSKTEKRILIHLSYKEFANKQENQKQEYISNVLNKILEDEDIMPVSALVPTYEKKALTEEEFFEIEFYFQVLPEIPLPDLSELSVTLPEPSLDMKEMALFKEDLLRKYARLQPISEHRKAQINDVCVFSIEAYGGKILVEELSCGKRALLLQEKDKELCLVQLLLTLEKGYTKGYFPPNPVPNCPTKNIEFKITLHEICKEVRPEDKVLAEKLKLNSEEDLNKFILTNVMSEQMQSTKKEGKAKLINALLEKQDFEIPSYFIQSFEREYKEEALEASLTMLEFKEEKALAEEISKAAIIQGKIHTFLLAMAFREHLEISEKEMNEYLRKVAISNRKKLEEVEAYLNDTGQISDIRERLLADKALELMYSKAKKIVLDKEGKPAVPPKIQ